MSWCPHWRSWWKWGGECLDLPTQAAATRTPISSRKRNETTHVTLRQLLSMGSMGVGLGRTTLMSSLLHSRTDQSSTTRAWT